MTSSTGWLRPRWDFRRAFLPQHYLARADCAIRHARLNRRELWVLLANSLTFAGSGALRASLAWLSLRVASGASSVSGDV